MTSSPRRSEGKAVFARLTLVVSALFRHFAIRDLQLLAAPTAIHEPAQHVGSYSAMVPTQVPNLSSPTVTQRDLRC